MTTPRASSENLIEPSLRLAIPLCVDLDGTLIASDLLQESIVRYVKGNPFRVFQLAAWLLRGRPFLKEQLAGRLTIDPPTMPWRAEVMEVLQREKRQGRPLYLVTAANVEAAKKLTAHLEIFDGVFGSDTTNNLKGRQKADFLCAKFGERGFDYVGDSRADYKVWAHSEGGMVVGSPARVQAAQRINPQVKEIKTKQISPIRAALKLMRIHQWAKNLIVFVPMITSHRLINPFDLMRTLLAFASLCAFASATYIFNDLIDMENDRLHRHKHDRPLASGAVTIPQGGIVALGLIFVGMAFAFWLPHWFWASLLFYVALTLAYSLYLKRTMLADAIALACLYTIRLLVGHAATHIPLSIWLLAFAVFIFFSLALAKRFAEVRNLSPEAGGDGVVRGRNYRLEDLPALLALGVSSGLTAVLVLVLYVNSPEVRQLYHQPMLLLLLTPAFLYWIGRIWILAQRGQLHEDPVLFALKDSKSYLVGFFAMAIMLLAALWK